jgi:OFA family oxalate/formate antiporter-like MFS transporter
LEPRTLPNRWLIAAAAVLMQLCLGAVYAWSVFIKPLAKTQPWSLVQISATFTIAMATLGVGTVLGGLWQDRVGPRIVSTFAGISYGCGFLVSAWAVSHHSLYTLWGGYGLMSGLGMGMGYICPVATITKWFPDLRGVMTGAAVMGFGAGAVVMSKIAARIVTDPTRVPVAFESFGVAYLILVVFAAQFLKNPPHGWCPEGWKPVSAVARTASLKHYTVAEALRTWRFWLLMLLISLNTSAGICIISQASPLAQQQLHITEIEAATIVAMISIFNATGRVFWAWISDLIGRAQTYFTLFAIQVFLFFLLPGVHDTVWFSITVCAIGLCYGGGFGVMPSFAADYFGSRNIGGIYGWILLGWGFAAIPSPLLIAHVRETTGTYTYAIYVVGFLMLISLTFPLLAARITRQRAEASA